MIVGDRLGVNYVAANLVAFVINVLVGYALHCWYTFSQRMSVTGLARYTLAMLIALPLSLFGMYVLKGLAHLPMLIASPAVTALLFVWNYLATHWAVFTRSFFRRRRALDQASS
jgi:putative flippase GtrA